MFSTCRLAITGVCTTIKLKRKTVLGTNALEKGINIKPITHTAKPVARTVSVPLSRTPAGGNCPSALIGTPGRHRGARTHVVASSGTSGCAKRSLRSSVETFRCQAVHVEPFEEVFRNSLRGLGHVPPVAVEELLVEDGAVGAEEVHRVESVRADWVLENSLLPN